RPGRTGTRARTARRAVATSARRRATAAARGRRGRSARSRRAVPRPSSEAVVEDEGRSQDLDRRQEVEGRVRANDGAARDERPPCSGWHVDRVTSPPPQPREERIERPGGEGQPVPARVPTLRRGQLRV